MDENYRCDYVEPGSRVECGNDMSFVPSARAPGEFVYCEKDGNLKHVIRVPADWKDILGKPEDFENAIYTILSWILDSSEYGELRTEDDVSRVKQYLNDVILRNCNVDFVADDNLVATLVSRYIESRNGEDARTRREDRATINDILSERRIEFDDDSTLESVCEADDDATLHDLYEGRL